MLVLVLVKTPIRNDIDALVEVGKLMETYEDTDVHSDVRYFGVN